MLKSLVCSIVLRYADTSSACNMNKMKMRDRIYMCIYIYIYICTYIIYMYI